jgi:LPPG:FO 2-phospho-L-lactate transferase
MCDEPVMTLVDTPAGRLQFQDYFVRRRHADPVSGVVFDGIAAATLPGGVREAIASASAVVFCPSNPFVSIGPMLAVPGMRAALDAASAPLVAVSPIVGGKALKGPADQMLRGLGHEVSALGVARTYRDLIDGFVIDHSDIDSRSAIEELGVRVLVTDAVMHSDDDRRRLADEVLAFVGELSIEY